MWLVMMGLAACGARATDSVADSETSVCAPLPALGEVLTINARMYDPDAACWRYTTVDVEAGPWAAYGPSDTGGPGCNDITVMVPRVDCSCMRLSSACGDVAAAMAADPAVDTSSEAYDRCADLDTGGVDCP